ncbi:Pentatricopeptide repeat-containing protein [Actinidia chinensis var. chinensis]|uniref:Pentatricopeptide repeat-containing protein n=1 Tax=Actinidia chinensis var. chinensis TaxID=1590841 RepID=A0A2R6PRX2_ACTCC|nr:Pentatricopeptide repeat-containing protein [Actinidia chinensis var. chinensis]
MNSLTHPKTHTRFPILGLKLVSSLSVAENPSILHDKNEQKLSPLDPIQLFNHWNNSRDCSARDTKIFHAHFLKTKIFHSNAFVANSLVAAYCKYAHMIYALKLFDKIPHPNIVSWNVMITGFNQNSLFEDSWRAFCRMRSFGFEPNEFTYGSVLSACSALQFPFCGKLVYSLVVKNGFFSNGYVRSGMIDLFAKYCCFEDALRVFYDVSCENVVCWNAIISGAVKNGENWVALNLFRQMCGRFLLPNSFTFPSILTACAALEELDLGKGVQGWVIKRGARGDVFVGTAIVDMYAKCGEMDEAVKEFFRMPVFNVVSWTAMISGFVQNDDFISVLQFFKEMIKLREVINNYTVTSVLTACADPAMVKEAIQIQCWIFKTGFYSDSAVKASLMNMYSKIGEIDLSEMVFKETEDFQDVGIWAVMISAFAQNRNSEKAIDMFQRMLQEGLKPNKFCSSSVLSIVDSLDFSRQIHCYTLKVGLAFDVSVGNSLSTMYSKCGRLVESYEVFQQIVEKDNVSCASMISGFAEHGHTDQAFQLFRDMLFEETVPDDMTLTAVLAACSAIRSLNSGKEVHAYAFRGGIVKKVLVCGALVNMYSKCGALDTARRVFDMMPVKDKVSCSSLVSGYAQNECIEEAVRLFLEMQMADLEVDSFTLSSILGAVSQLNGPGIGTQLHAHVIKTSLESEVSVGSSLLRMYSKCGSIDDCRKAFLQIKKPDLISWTAMISSYAQHGKGAEALRLYELMRESGTEPDSVTFVGVLSACSHSGLIEEGYFHLKSMVKDYGIEPGYRHYACMVDLLGRSGRLKEAERFIKNMPIKPDSLVWGTLLAACKMHGDIELGRLAAQKVLEFEPYDVGAYVSLSNMCADVGQWEEVLKIRHVMDGTGARKDPGWSTV